MKPSQLPVNPKSGVHLVCIRGCYGQYSATRGDYFNRPQDETMTCYAPLDVLDDTDSVCGARMVLVEEATSYRRISPAKAESKETPTSKKEARQ
jgi:hypothetical protein